MHFRLLAILVLLFAQSAFSQGRAPAVEDFVGIEVEHPEATPQGTESLYNLEKDLQEVQTVEAKALTIEPKKPIMRAPSAETVQWTPVQMTTFGMLLILPLMIWFMVMNHLKRKASIESASNVEVLDKYRKERELRLKEEKEQKKVA